MEPRPEPGRRDGVAGMHASDRGLSVNAAKTTFPQPSEAARAAAAPVVTGMTVASTAGPGVELPPGRGIPSSGRVPVGNPPGSWWSVPPKLGTPCTDREGSQDQLEPNDIGSSVANKDPATSKSASPGEFPPGVTQGALAPWPPALAGARDCGRGRGVFVHVVARLAGAGG